MLPRNDPDRIQITFDHHRQVANCRAAPTHHLGPPPRPAPTGLGAPGLGRCAGPGQHRPQGRDVGSVCAGCGDCIDDADVLRTGDSPHPGRHGQGAIHPERLPAAEESPPGSAQGHHPHGPQAWPASFTTCCGTAKCMWMPTQSTTKAGIVKGRSAPPSGVPANWATNWSP